MQRPSDADRTGGRLPRYMQISASLRAQIERGDWSVGQAFPSIQKLSASYKVAPETIRQALSVLEQEGLISRRQGIGTIVEATPRDLRWRKLPSDWHGLVDFLGQIEVRRLLIENANRRPVLHPHEGKPAASYRFLKRVHSRKDEPFCLLSAHLSTEIYNREPRRFREEVIVSVLSRMPGIRIGKVLQTLRFDVADMELARLLSVPVASPVVWLRRSISDSAGNNIYLADIAYRGDVVFLDLDLSP